jgi:hypothetical protein
VGDHRPDDRHPWPTPGCGRRSAPGARGVRCRTAHPRRDPTVH